jgi:hypothetical protein
LHHLKLLSALAEGDGAIDTEVAAERIVWSLLAVAAILIIAVALFGWL